MLQGRENVEERALFGYTEKVNRQSSTLNLIQMMSWELSDTMNKIAQNLEYCKDLTAFCAQRRFFRRYGRTDLHESLW